MSQEEYPTSTMSQAAQPSSYVGSQQFALTEFDSAEQATFFPENI